jgi:NADH-quinone oxidoreductase subunit C
MSARLGGKDSLVADAIVQKWPAKLEDTLERLTREHSDTMFSLHEFRGETTLIFDKKDLHKVLSFLKADGFNYLVDVSSAHYPERGEIEIVYLVRDLKTVRQVRVKAALPVEDPRVESAVDVWAGANWPEREVYDLMGIVFEGHPDLRRILMPEDFEDFPLRKEYPVEGDDSWRNFLKPGEGE